QRGHEVRQRLPHAGTRLRDERPAVGERALYRARELALLRPLLVSRERSRERSVRGERGRDRERARRGRRRRGARCRESALLPRAAHRLGRGLAEERGERRPEERRVGARLREERGRQRAGAAREVGEDRGARERVVESTVRRVRVDLRGGRERLERVRRRGRHEDRGELHGVEPLVRREAGALEEGQVEGDVVADHRRVADERRERGQRGRDGRRPGEVGVADPGETRDRGTDGDARIDERREAIGDGHAAVALETDADGADLDDAVYIRVEAGRLEVEGYQIQGSLLLGREGGPLRDLPAATDAANVLTEGSPPQ